MSRYIHAKRCQLGPASEDGAPYNMISSTAFPKLTFIRAPNVGPSRCATLSVAKVKRPARGMIATALRAKTTLGLIPAKCTAMPTGTKINKTFPQLWKSAVFALAQTRVGIDFLGFSSSVIPSFWAGLVARSSSCLHGLNLFLCADVCAHALTRSTQDLARLKGHEVNKDAYAWLLMVFPSKIHCARMVKIIRDG